MESTPRDGRNGCRSTSAGRVHPRQHQEGLYARLQAGQHIGAAARIV